MVTPELFRRYPTAETMAKAPLPALEKIIRTTGFFRMKAKSLKGAAAGLVERFGGEVPRTLAELTTLPGVARKTANVVLGTAYGIAEGVVVDTHVQRLSMRLGADAQDRPEGHREGPDEGDPAGALDPVLPPGDLARPPRLLRAQAELRRLHAGAVLPVGGSGSLSGAATASTAGSRRSRRRTSRERWRVALLPSAGRSQAWIASCPTGPVTLSHLDLDLVGEVGAHAEGEDAPPVMPT